jgi:PAS domain S-box-containing protein
MQEQIVTALRAAVVVVDGEDRIRTVNPAAARVLGVAAGDVGETVEGAHLLERIPALRQAISDVRGGAERAVLVAVPIALDGEELALNALVTPFVAADADRGSVLVVAEDVTEELRTKARLIDTERLAAIGRMAAHVTHEVRNPLSSIGLNVEMLEEELAGTGPEAKALMRAIQREIDRLTGVTEEYLRLARLPDPRLEPEDIGALVRSIASFVTREMEGSRVSIVLDVEEGLPPVAIDEQQIRQALLNLLRNAREAMPEGGHIFLAAERRGDGVEVRVRDEGPGIPDAERERIFDLFYTTKERGTGLGLPLTQQIVVAHGGHIRCEGGPGRGTTFDLWLPIADEPSDGPRTPLARAIDAGPTEH